MDITPSTSPNIVSNEHIAIHSEKHKHLFEGMHIHFPNFKRDRLPKVVNVNEEFAEQLTVGQKVADKVASNMGSWRFIITQGTILVVWIIFNSVALFYHFDSYPYILLNLVLSFQAGFAAPIIMMAQNRQAEKDRLTAQNDYLTDCKSEEEVRHVMAHLDHQDTLILQIVKRLKEQHLEMKEHLARLDPTLAQRLGVDLIQASRESLEGTEEISGNL